MQHKNGSKLQQHSALHLKCFHIKCYRPSVARALIFSSSSVWAILIESTMYGGSQPPNIHPFYSHWKKVTKSSMLLRKCFSSLLILFSIAGWARPQSKMETYLFRFGEETVQHPAIHNTAMHLGLHELREWLEIPQWSYVGFFSRAGPPRSALVYKHRCD